MLRLPSLLSAAIVLLSLGLLIFGGLYSNSRHSLPANGPGVFAMSTDAGTQNSRHITGSAYLVKCGLPLCHQYPPSAVAVRSETRALVRDGNGNPAAWSMASWRKQISLEVDPPIPRSSA